MVEAWRDIAEAPRDGTLLRLKSPKYVPDDIFWWDRKAKRWATILFAVARKVDGWWSEDEEQPTHFQLLPAPPEQKGQDNG